MIKRGYVGIRRVSRLGISLNPQAACRGCQSRSLHASGSRLQEEEEVIEKSALDGLFDASDAYDHKSENPRVRKNFKSNAYNSQKVPRTVLGDDLSKDIDSSLNQEWDGEPKRGNLYQSSSNNSTPLRGPHIGSAPVVYKGMMTSSESKVFSEIFATFFHDGSETIKPIQDDGALGGSFSGNKAGTIQDFQKRNRLEQKNKLARKRYLSSVLSERVSWSEISEDEIERKIDEAREEIVGCSSVSDVWQWATRNVWGMNTEKQQQQQQELHSSEKHNAIRGDSSQDIDRTSEQMEISKKSDVEKRDVRFGMATPYYSPVLLLLLTNLRDRFCSPQVALSVLRIAKNLGPDSFVLGCSPQLYAEVIRTQWMVLRDLDGARNVLREAKDTGILGRDSPMQLLGDQPNPKDEESRLKDIVSKQIKRDVEFQVMEGIKRLPKGQTPLIYERQLELISEMNKMLFSYPKPASRDKYQSRPSQRFNRHQPTSDQRFTNYQPRR